MNLNLDFWLMTAFASHRPSSSHSHPGDCMLPSFREGAPEESRLNVGPRMYLSAFSCCCVNAEPGRALFSQPRMTQRSHSNNSKRRGWGSSPLGMGMAQSSGESRRSHWRPQAVCQACHCRKWHKDFESDTHRPSILDVYPDKERRQRCLLCHEVRN